MTVKSIIGTEAPDGERFHSSMPNLIGAPTNAFWDENHRNE